MNVRIAIPFLAAATVGCGASTFIDDVNFLRRHTDVILLMPERPSDSTVAVCPELQGRVMTTTGTGSGGLSFGWINRDLIASGEKRPHINAYGGEDRLWLGPEGGPFSLFFAPGEPQDFTHWQTPPPVDSEPWDVAKQTTQTLLLRKKMRLRNASGTLLELEVQREIRVLSANEPGKFLGIQPDEQVRWVGYQSRNKITNLGDREWKRETGLLSAWVLGMFNPSPQSTIVVPFKEGPDEKLGPAVTDDYFGKVPPDRLRIEPGVIYFKGDGLFRSKIGISPRRSLGVLGSYDSLNESLTIVQFNQPKDAREYVNSKWGAQQDPFSGDAANSYNDGPPSPGVEPLGPFYELESSSPALGLRPGNSFTHVHTTFHFQGPIEGINKIARRVLGVDLSRIASAFPQ